MEIANIVTFGGFGLQYGTIGYDERGREYVWFTNFWDRDEALHRHAIETFEVKENQSIGLAREAFRRDEENDIVNVSPEPRQMGLYVRGEVNMVEFWKHFDRCLKAA